MKKPKLYTELSISKAVKEVKNGGKLSTVAKNYHLSRDLLRNRVREDAHGLVLRKKQGKKTALTEAREKELHRVIHTMAECGFGPAMVELQNIVKEFVITNEIETPFKQSKPGYDWVRSFLHRYNLKLTKGLIMQLCNSKK